MLIEATLCERLSGGYYNLQDVRWFMPKPL